MPAKSIKNGLKSFLIDYLVSGKSSFNFTNKSDKNIVAFGGHDILSPGNGYKYHIFKGPSSFNVFQGGLIDYFIVAGGGGSGMLGGPNPSGNQPGGGGGGGVRTGTVLFPSGSYNISVGLGGQTIRVLSVPSVHNGQPSSVSRATGQNLNIPFSTISATGGGAGGNGRPTASAVSGNPGGSGGGGSAAGASGGSGGTGNAGGYTPAEGFNGCSGIDDGVGTAVGGAGGGAGGAAVFESPSTAFPWTPTYIGKIAGPGIPVFNGDSGIPPAYGTPGPGTYSPNVPIPTYVPVAANPGRFFAGGGGGVEGNNGGGTSSAAATLFTGGGSGCQGASPGLSTLGMEGGPGIIIFRYRD
jgi:hypothetical protein